MTSLEQFDILNILGGSILSATYKAKDQKSGNIFVLKGIPLESFSDQEKKCLVKKINTRKEVRHPNMLKFFGVIEEKQILYKIEEFCFFGNLQNFIEKECVAKEKRIQESLLCKILYQTALTIKTLDFFCGKLCVENIFLDEEFNIKLYNFYTDFKSCKSKEAKMSNLGTILFDLATLKTFDKTTFEKDLQELTYSNSFVSLLNYMLTDNNDLKKNINKILCHPTVLLKTSQWTKENCFLSAPPPLKDPVRYEEIFEINGINTDSDKPEKLRKGEANVQMKQQKLREWERKLEQKEKKLLIMERNVKEKLQQAELYLKRCRERSTSTTSSGSSKSSTLSSTKSRGPSTKKITYYEDLNDSLYVSCGDSIIESTSAKLNVEKIEKPKGFVRAMSERRIRFKTSPLKENRFNRKSHFRSNLKGSKIVEDNIEAKESVKNKENIITTLKSKAQLFSDNNNFYENEFPKQIQHPEFLENKPHDGKKVGWTQESKRYAFELLRIMNSNCEEKNEKDPGKVQHTYL